ncbi:MAG TPA: hypothetical protein VK994_08210, partial [Bacteroidales bacterium]|nr:hypothetical protein [Bacteroidales bacterium]
ENDIAFKLRYRLAGGAFGDDYLMLSSDISPDIWGVTSYGRVRQDYKGNFQAHLIYSTAPRSALFIDNTNALAEARAINATISNSSANESSVGIAGFNAGDGSAIYGGNTGHGNFGFIGTQEYGVFGQNDNNNWAALGTANAAVYGSMGDGITAQVLADGDFAIKGRGVYDLSQEGSGYAYNATIGGVLGHNPAGSPYSFGVAGYTATANEKRSGAVFGSFYDASEWGCLAYRASGAGNRYGGYFTSTELSGGDNATSVTFANVGIGAWGGLMGANINGEVYGLYARGTDYSIYARGDVYRTGADIHIQENTGGANTVLYTLVTTDMVIQTYGVGQLEKGKSNIVFDQAFSEAVSTEEPVVVTITPIGKSNGVYLDEVDAMGFSVAENGNGKSNVQFSWIAIGKRKGFEDKVLPEDVIAKDYNDKIQRGLVNDNDPDASSEGIYYRDGKLYNGQIQENRTGTPVIQDIPLKAKQPLKSEVADGNEMDKGSN